MEEELRRHLRKLDQWDLMQLLRTERDVDKRQKIRARSSAHPQELALLAEDEDSGVRFYVAANPHTPLEVQLRLVQDLNALVRGGLALAMRYDPAEPQEVRRLKEGLALRLGQDPQPLVRLALAGNLYLPDSAYQHLTMDPDPVVRQKLAENVQAPHSALVTLAQDSIRAVQVAALRHRNMPRDWLEKMSQEPQTPVRVAVGENINTPLAVLEQLAMDPDPQVRKAVASHPHAPLELLRVLSGDAAQEVVMAIAEHPRADRALLMELSGFDRDPTVRLLARQRLTLLLKEEIREDVLERWETR